MRLPYLQVASEVERLAVDLAAVLDWTEPDAGWGLVKLFRWALDRCPDNAPPSANDVVRGPSAARQIARVAMWKGEPMEFVQACEGLMPPILERTPEGIRVKGLDRYDEAWAASLSRTAKAKHAAEKRWVKAMPGQSSGDAPAMLNACSTHAPAMLNGCSGDAQANARAMPQDAYTYTQTYTQIEKQIKKGEAEAEEVVAPPPVKTSGPRVYEKPTAPVASWTAPEFFAWAQSKRQEAGLVGERVPRNLGAWFNEVMLTVGGEAELLLEAFYAFGNDKHWQAAAPPLPFVAFMSQWEKYAPRRSPDAHP